MEIPSIYALYQKADYTVITDSRQLNGQNCIFFALRGERFDGNQYALEALQKGAIAAVVDDDKLAGIAGCIYVKNALVALQQLANYHRLRLNIPIIAVGGSNGKTTTKELIYRVLQEKFRVFATPGNLNNHIGVPLSLLSIKPDVEIAVIEMGANALLETQLLCEIAAPNYGVVTNVGLDHLEGFGSIESVAKANAELYDYLAAHNGTAFINTQEPFLQELAQKVPYKITYPQKTDSCHVEAIDSDFFVTISDKNHQKTVTQLYGNYNFANVATAFCVGTYFEVANHLIHAAIKSYKPSNNRSQLIQAANGNIIICDAYNANPSSMEAALRQFVAISATHKIAIIGDMLEMGTYSEHYHKQIGTVSQAITAQGGEVWLCGAAMKAALATNPKALHFEHTQAVQTYLAQRNIKNTHILLKASRGIGLEKLLPTLNPSA